MKNAIVIGGGIAGCSTAYALSQRDMSVTLVERQNSVAQEASGNPIAMLYPKFNTGTSILSQLTGAGFSFTSALLKKLPNNNKFYDICGQVQLAFNRREQEKQESLLKNINLDEGIQWLNVEELSERANMQLSNSGLYLSGAGWVKPKILCETLIQSRGISCITASKVVSINQVDSIWQVVLEEKVLETDAVVICNANDILLFEQCQQIPITPVRGQVNFFPENQLSRRIKTVICSDHYLSPSVDGWHSVGTSYAPNDFNAEISIKDTHANLQSLNQISSDLYDSIDLSSIKGRVAWRSATVDYMPLAGQLIDEPALRRNPPRYNDKPKHLPWQQGLYVNAGHGSKGMITAPLCAELIANQICNEPLSLDNAIASNLNPSRFLLKDLGLKKIAQNLITF